ncbi:hypothetical protein [Actinomadura sp. BRA 177]|uniref:hypothetical protein n=1 Tax=Actinomadura sp. BRA 177 TaxID=2745202 RepID=UPI0015954EF0|nr:hypothetical protein [Actinomadura sp. BRA 177]NVI88136.1 hypothetical protein [Actinomadura sp. BRA 177]
MLPADDGAAPVVVDEADLVADLVRGVLGDFGGVEGAAGAEGGGEVEAVVVGVVLQVAHKCRQQCLGVEAIVVQE